MANPRSRLAPLPLLAAKPPEPVYCAADANQCYHTRDHFHMLDPRHQFSSQDAEGPPAGRPAGLQLCVLLGTAQGTTPALLDTQCGATASRWCRPCSRHATQSGRCPGLPLQVYRRQPIRTIHPEPSQAQIRTSNLGDLTAFSSASSHAVPSDWSIPTPCYAVGLSIRWIDSPRKRRTDTMDGTCPLRFPVNRGQIVRRAHMYSIFTHAQPRYVPAPRPNFRLPRLPTESGRLSRMGRGEQEGYMLEPLWT